MEIWQSILVFFTENPAVLAIVAGLTVIATILGQVTDIFKPLKNKYKAAKDKKNKQLAQLEELRSAITQLTTKVDDLSASVTAEIESIRNDLQRYITDDTAHRAEILDAIKNLEEGNAYCLGEMIRRMYFEHKDRKEIPEKDFELLMKAYKVYHNKFGGNGPIQRMFEEIKDEWAVIY